jgi:hypothetical protein
MQALSLALNLPLFSLFAGRLPDDRDRLLSEKHMRLSDRSALPPYREADMEESVFPITPQAKRISDRRVS